MKEKELPGGRSLRPSAAKQRRKPLVVDELLVVRKPIDRKDRIAGPSRPAGLEDPNAALAQLGQPRPERHGVFGPVAIEDDLSAPPGALGPEQPFDLGAIDALEPGAREGDRSGNMATSSRPARPPPVVCGQRPNVDDREVWVAEPLSKFG